MADTPNPTEFATSMLHLLQRFTGNHPDALKQMREQVENELRGARDLAARAEAQLAALDQLQALIDEGDMQATTDVPVVAAAAPPLKNAIVRILDEEPGRRWRRWELYEELKRRGWGPGGVNPKNTFTSRLRDLEKEARVDRVDRNVFKSVKRPEVTAM
jgi:hypothetical protein